MRGSMSYTFFPGNARSKNSRTVKMELITRNDLLANRDAQTLFNDDSALLGLKFGP